MSDGMIDTSIGIKEVFHFILKIKPQSNEPLSVNTVFSQITTLLILYTI